MDVPALFVTVDSPAAFLASGPPPTVKLPPIPTQVNPNPRMAGRAGMLGRHDTRLEDRHRRRGPACQEIKEPGTEHVVMADPEGNEFCVQ